MAHLRWLSRALGALTFWKKKASPIITPTTQADSYTLADEAAVVADTVIHRPPPESMRTCTNCGVARFYGEMTTCRRLDMCPAGTNDNIMSQLTTEEMNDILKSGGRVFTEDPNPLCHKCASESNFTCVWCELKLYKEGLA